MSTKTPWWAWDRLCQPKRLGGTGFRDLAVFNQALLAKQVWRVMTKPDVLVSRVLKARYFKHSSILEARRGHDPSFAWRSIWAAKALLLEGLKWRVGNGYNINVWTDAWLPGPPPQCVPRPNLEADPTMRVADFIDFTNGGWRDERLRQWLSGEEVQRVYEIPLSRGFPPDQMYWWPTKNGEYSVKLGYWLGRNCTPPIVLQEEFLQSGECWKLLWNLQVPPKLSHFLWRVFSNTSPVKSLLAQRHCCESSSCDLCGDVEETATHVQFECRGARETWVNSTFHELLSSVPSYSCPGRLMWVLKRVSLEEKGCFLAICWSLWCSRNLRVFADKPVLPHVVITGLIKTVTDYQSFNANVSTGGEKGVVGSRSWVTPPEGSVKINTDAAIFDNGEVGLGVIGRDAEGSVIMVASKRIIARWSPETAETKAIQYGLEQCVKNGFQHFILESDSLNAITNIQKKANLRIPIGLVVDDVVSVLNSFTSCSVSFVKRGRNTVAHYIARLCRRAGDELSYHCNFPQTILDLAGFDLI